MQLNEQRVDIRKRMRNLRRNLCAEAQEHAAKSLCINISQVTNLTFGSRIGGYLSNDGEPSLDFIFKEMWSKKATPYLPIIHPFSGQHLLFQEYEKNSPMKANRYAILEPELNCSHICPVAELDVVLTPLVAFDSQGNRLGMGGGYYDRTFAQIPTQATKKPVLIGVAHQCQEVDSLPVASWDVPLDYIVTPERIYCPNR